MNVGGKGTYNCENNICLGGYNGGGNNHYDKTQWGTGGGATHIAFVKGLLKELENFKEDILIVAGGGGGGYSYLSGEGGSAGGYIGNSGIYREGFIQAFGGTQTKGGTGKRAGSFGQGGSHTTGNCSGGGGGFYGGGAAYGSSSAG
ncbi:MAG: hypothetical protein IJ193_09205, partial [Bacilli bacterium]|nr:hypothetical protein [Bacilli bacterium]